MTREARQLPTLTGGAGWLTLIAAAQGGYTGALDDVGLIAALVAFTGAALTTMLIRARDFTGAHGDPVPSPLPPHESERLTDMSETSKHITVFGATGGTGLHFVRAALTAGHIVTAVAREPSRMPISHEHLRTVRGDVLDPPSLTARLDDADAVVSVLGVGNGRKPTTLYSAGVANILDLMGSAGVHRFVGISALPVTPRDQVGAIQRLLIFPVLYRFFGGSYADMTRMEQLLQESTANWTVLRPPRLTNGPATGRYRTALNEPLHRAGKISRADLAGAILEILDDPTAMKATVAVAY